MLQDRKYIDVKKNQVYATDKGKVLITAIGDKILTSPEMTAKWEQRLAEIGEGTASPATFMEQTKKLSAKIIEDAVEMSEKWDFTGLHVESIERTGSKFTVGKKVGQCKSVMEMSLISPVFMAVRTIIQRNVISQSRKRY